MRATKEFFEQLKKECCFNKSAYVPIDSCSTDLEDAKKRIKELEGQLLQQTEELAYLRELKLHMEEIEEVKKFIIQKNSEIQELQSKYTPGSYITLNQIEAYIMECPDWATAKSKIDAINTSGILAETDWAKVERRIQSAFKKSYTANNEALQAAINRPTFTVYPQANSTTNVGCDQQSSEFKTFVAEQDTTSIKVDNTEHKSISNNKNI